MESSELLLEECEQSWDYAKSHASQFVMQSPKDISLLINRMMMNNPVNVVGEGLVGRAAFTGNHQWILSESYLADGHPPEVLNEVHCQLSAGMQTIAVIPVLPHGVFQFGSSLSMKENFGFVNEVQNLILQRSYVPDLLFTTNEPSLINGAPIPVRTSVSMDSFGEDNRFTSSIPFVADSCNQLNNLLLGSTDMSLDQSPNSSYAFAASNDTLSRSNIRLTTQPKIPCKSQLQNGAIVAEVIKNNLAEWCEPQDFSFKSIHELSHQPWVAEANANDGLVKHVEPHKLDNGVLHHVSNNPNIAKNRMESCSEEVGGFIPNFHKCFSSNPLYDNGRGNHLQQIPVSCSSKEPHGSTEITLSGTNTAAVEIQNSLQIAKSAIMSLDSVSRTENYLTTNDLPSGGPIRRNCLSSENHFELSSRKELIENGLFQSLNAPSVGPDMDMSSKEHIPGHVDPRVHPPTGDDLFDIFGLDFKNKLLGGYGNNFHNEANVNAQNHGKDNSLSESGIFSGDGTDHLLDAVVASIQSASKQNSDDSASCRTSLTNISGSPQGSKSPAYGQTVVQNKIEGELFGLQKPFQKSGSLGSNSFISGSGKDGSGNCSQTSSICNSQISSWVEQGRNLKRDVSVSTEYSKGPDENTKSNRKRLKPGESHRPRPKDRQMIQDRVKELREIVPNGAKCSIDALLEKTIKHMLFLQSVTKHADKLQQTEESKITGKEGGLLLKDNIEGGATWAFEIGSQSMVCPIVVEDLNQPRQMLVEMLCEEQGFFLEIADIIRGLGLTILKGVMEVRNDKIWARFSVEANRDITRMDIFMSLVGLLDQTGKSPLSDLNTHNLMVHHSFPKACSAPTTNRPSSFQ